LFSAFLGFSPVQHLLGVPVLSHLSQANRAVLNGRGFFPSLISTPFRDGLHAAFDFAVVACLIAAGASWLRGGKYVYSERTGTEVTPAEASGEGDHEPAFDPAVVS